MGYGGHNVLSHLVQTFSLWEEASALDCSTQPHANPGLNQYGEPRSGFSPQMVDAYLGTDVGYRELGFCFQNTWLAMQRLTPMNRHVALVFADGCEQSAIWHTIV